MVLFVVCYCLRCVLVEPVKACGGERSGELLLGGEETFWHPQPTGGTHAKFHPQVSCSTILVDLLLFFLLMLLFFSFSIVVVVVGVVVVVVVVAVVAVVTVGVVVDNRGNILAPSSTKDNYSKFHPMFPALLLLLMKFKVAAVAVAVAVVAPAVVDNAR